MIIGLRLFGILAYTELYSFGYLKNRLFSLITHCQSSIIIVRNHRFLVQHQVHFFLAERLHLDLELTV